MYNSKGALRATGEDFCDCLDNACDGCHFPCESCGSPKCGIQCRVNRKWRYDKIDSDGREESVVVVNDKIKSPALQKKNQKSN